MITVSSSFKDSENNKDTNENNNDQPISFRTLGKGYRNNTFYTKADA